MRVVEPVEILYLSLMHRWERSAPPDKHLGEFGGQATRNTQTERLKFVLEKIALGRPETTEHVYATISRHTRRQDGESYISRNAKWMVQPEALSGGWYFEGCTSLEQKNNVVAALSYIPMTSPFVQAVADFIANKSIEPYLPIEEDEPAVMARIRAWEAKNEG